MELSIISIQNLLFIDHFVFMLLGTFDELKYTTVDSLTLNRRH